MFQESGSETEMADGDGLVECPGSRSETEMADRDGLIECCRKQSLCGWWVNCVKVRVCVIDHSASKHLPLPLSLWLSLVSEVEHWPLTTDHWWVQCRCVTVTVDRRYHHPCILTLMGLCQTEHLEGLVLLYERVACGSLYTFLHHKVITLSITFSLSVSLCVSVCMSYRACNFVWQWSFVLEDIVSHTGWMSVISWEQSVAIHLVMIRCAVVNTLCQRQAPSLWVVKRAFSLNESIVLYSLSKFLNLTFEHHLKLVIRSVERGISHIAKS